MVSSIVDKSLPILSRASADVLRKLLDRVPINHPEMGSNTRTKAESSGLKTNIQNKYIITVIGSRKANSREFITDTSSSLTSVVAREIISPFRLSVKYDNGRERILLYSWLRMSRTTPLRIGAMKYIAR